MGHLRRAVHQNLIRAHTSMARKSKADLCVLREDVDKDGIEEILLWTPNLSLGLDPAQGGELFEICHLAKALNITDTLTRRAELYHSLIHAQQEIGGGSGEGIASIHLLQEPLQ